MHAVFSAKVSGISAGSLHVSVTFNLCVNRVFFCRVSELGTLTQVGNHGRCCALRLIPERVGGFHLYPTSRIRFFIALNYPFSFLSPLMTCFY